MTRLCVICDAPLARNRDQTCSEACAKQHTRDFVERVGQEDRERQYLQVLEMLAEHDLRLLKTHKFPTLTESNIVFSARHEEVYYDVNAIFDSGSADADSLVTWRIAELRKQGINATPLIISRKGPAGGRIYTVKVQLPDGSTEDPVAVVQKRTPRS